jgi:hypothetical protein
MMAIQRKGEATRAKFGICSQRKQLFAKHAQGDLRFGAFQRGAGDTKKDVSAPVELRGATGGVGQVRRPFVQTCAIAFDVQDPASCLRKPVAQFAFVAAHSLESRMGRRHQRTHQ